ncbi:MAG TPA: hypothetical protein PKH50_01135 [bacterium]|jgi:hypothetical protein|nr:hypothetical protein [bacterium]
MENGWFFAGLILGLVAVRFIKKFMGFILSKEDETERSWSSVGLFAFFAVVVVFISGFIGQWVWVWVVPDVFAGAVEKGVLPASITFGQALKLFVLLCAFTEVAFERYYHKE